MEGVGLAGVHTPPPVAVAPPWGGVWEGTLGLETAD